MPPSELNIESDHVISKQSEICYIGLGSNLDLPIIQIQKAINTFANSKHIELLATSSLYKSPPMGPQEQDNYINAVVTIRTNLQPIELLDSLQAIEKSQGRVRKEQRWGARTLDLDLLLYGNQIIESDRLTLPHYGISERAFVLYPLQEIAAEISLPNGVKLSSIISKLEKDTPIIEKLKSQ